jgi:hypothetical protein
LRAGREGEVERRTFVDGTVRPDRAAVAMHGADDGGQTDSAAGELALAVKPMEGAEQRLGVRHLEAGAVVGHEVHRHAVLLDRPEPNPRVIRLGRELEGVAQQVLQHALHEPAIPVGDQPILDLDLDLAVRLDAAEFGDDLCGQALMSIGSRSKGCRDRRESFRISSISVPIRTAPARTRSR